MWRHSQPFPCSLKPKSGGPMAVFDGRASVFDWKLSVFEVAPLPASGITPPRRRAAVGCARGYPWTRARDHGDVDMCNSMGKSTCVAPLPTVCATPPCQRAAVGRASAAAAWRRASGRRRRHGGSRAPPVGGRGCGSIQYTAIQYTAIQYNAVQYDTMPGGCAERRELLL